MKPSKVDTTTTTKATDPEKEKAIRASIQVDRFYNSILRTPTKEKLNPKQLPSTASTSAMEQSTSSTAGIPPVTASITSEVASKSATQKSGRKSILISATPSASEQAGPSRRKSVSTASDHSSHQKTQRTKSIIMLGSKSMALFMESESEAESGVADDPLLPHKKALPAKQAPATETPKVEGPTGTKGGKSAAGKNKGKSRPRVRTFRIWKPNQDRKSITVQVGDEQDHEEADKIFETSQIRQKSYNEWRKQAKARLPSVSGGTPVAKVADLINMAPTLQKEEDPRVLQKTIRRLSKEAEELAKPAEAKRKTSVKVDYTKFREMPRKEKPEVKEIPQEKIKEIPWKVKPEVEEIPQQEKVKEIPQVEKVKELPQAAKVKEIPQAAKVKEIPQVEKVKETPQVAKVKEIPQAAKVKEIPQMEKVKEIPQKEKIKEVPRKEVNKSVSGSVTSASSNHMNFLAFLVPDLKVKSSSSDSDVVIEVPSDTEERRLENERKKAGEEFKEKIKTLRELADHLSNKRPIRHQLTQEATGFILLDTEQIPLKEHILYVIEDLGSIIHDCVDYCVIWKKEIREINGRFGVVISSYFIWLRQMVALELFAFFVTNAFIIIPQIVEDINDTPEEHKLEKQIGFKLSDLISGEGSFHTSYLYYTGYHSRNEDSDNPFLNPAFRFLFCMLFMFFVLTYFIFSRLTRYYQNVRMESTVSNLAKMEHFKSIICGWDFSCRDPQAKFYLHKTIHREMYLLARASKEHRGTATVQMEMETKKFLAYAVKRFGFFWGPWVLHIAGNILILLSCVVLALILIHLCKLKLFYYLECVSLRDDINYMKTLHHRILCPAGDQFLHTWILSLPALFASMTTLLLTKLILIVGDNETWNTPERKIYATMVRAGLFNFTSIGVFYTFWISRKPILKEEGFVGETIFAKELYRLVVIQGVVDVILNFGVKGCYHLVRRRKKGYRMTEFRTEYCSLSMFFIHSVSRIGTLFCPPLSIFVTLRLVLDFYQNRFALLHLSAKDSYSAHASQVYAPFLLTFFILCYLITSFMNVYYIAETTPSGFNGPFKRYNESYDEVLGLLLESEKGISWLAGLAHPAFLVIFNVTLGGLVFCCRQWGHTYEPIIAHLNDLITTERGDRDLILKAIFEIGQVTADKVVRDSRSTLKSRRSALFKAISTVIPEPDDTETEDEDGIDKKKRSIPVHKRSMQSKQDAVARIGGRGDHPPPKKDQQAAQKSDPIPTAPSSSASTIDVDKLEKTVDKQITEFIHQVKRGRRSLDMPVNTQAPRKSVAFERQQPPQQRFSVSNEVAKNRELTEKQKTMKVLEDIAAAKALEEKALQDKLAQEANRKEFNEKQKAMKALDQKVNQERVHNMNNILGNIVENRRKIQRGAGMNVGAGTTQPKPVATVPAQTRKQSAISLHEQISQLAVATTANAAAAKRRQSVIQTTPSKAATKTTTTATQRAPGKMKR